MSLALTLIHLSVEAAGVMMSLLAIMAIAFGEVVDRRERRWFLLLFACLIASLVGAMALSIVRSSHVAGSHELALLAQFWFLLFTPLLGSIVAALLLEFVDPQRTMRGVRAGVGVLAAAHALGLATAQATGAYYTVSGAEFAAGPLFWLYIVLALAPLAICAGLLVRANAQLTSRLRLAFWISVAVPVYGALAVIANGMFAIVLAMTFSGLVMFVFILAERVERDRQRERELAELQAAVTISQIQPHFLYNTLDSIYFLADKDPAATKDAIGRFSSYLRGNLNSIRRTAPVDIATELAHVRTYLELEQMSSGDTIAFELDAQDAGFLVPALSVQPLVENAVKHGVGKRPGGGTVQVATRAVPGGHEVTVRDDGVGFDVQADAEGPGAHIGIQNVRARVEQLVGGTLSIESEPGAGTVATIFVPAEGAGA